MRILFLTRHFGYLRGYESTVRELASRGHQIHLAADREEALGAKAMVERWCAGNPSMTHGWTPDRESDDWLWLSTRMRLAQDFLRFQDPRYDAAPQLRLRAEERMPTLALAALKVLGYRTARVRRFLGAVLSGLEQAVPANRALESFIREQAPDLVLITPLVELGSPQLDHLRIARRLGVRTALCVGSWDHLSSKSLIRVWPDRVFVWNDIQKHEAVELHGVPADRIVVTGAQCFDEWFGRAPRASRAEFCRRFHLDPAKPVILWVCSSLFRGGRPESELVEEWVRRIRANDNPLLRTAGILVRPHPQRVDEWRRIDLSEYGNIAIRGGNPIEDAAKADYFDALYHSAAVVGINTSALIEAGIVGRPVLSLVDEIYSRNQEGTLHWPYLLKIGGGLVRAGRGFDEHLAQLADSLGGRGPDNRLFVEAFVRPFGVDRAATPVLVEAIHALAGAPAPARADAAPLAPLVRPFLYPLIWYRRLRSEWIFFRKRTRRDVKRSWHGTKRGLRQGIKLGLKVLILDRLRNQPPQVVLPKIERQRARAQDMFEGVEEVEETKEALTRLARRGHRIIVGPWLSETGFELLYWIPFLNWAKAYGNIRDDRLIVVSRGGCASWYGHLSGTYHDVFDFFTPQQFLERNQQRILQQGGNQKHNDVAEFDEEIVDRVRTASGARDAELLHPSLMYKLFRIFWRLQASVGLVQGYTVHRKMPPLPLGSLASQLPRSYIAVKFYTNNSFPDTPQNRAFVASYLTQLSAADHVVLLNTGVRFDDHDEFRPADPGRIHVVDHLMTPRNNLDVQTRIIGAARAFVGTYGGFSYLAPLSGVSALAFFSDPSGFRVDHLEIAKRVFTELNTPSFLPMHVRDLDVLKIGLGLGDDAPPVLPHVSRPA